MRTYPELEVNETSENELLKLCLNGDRNAFAHLVRQYQSLICSLAYSACGNLSRSEDLAQETFVTAWQKLESLRDHDRFKSWLCGIARNLINQSIRQEKRNPIAASCSLGSIAESPSSNPSPVENAIRAEEESLVWQSLERIPETYREPLVLFYRENQSILRVAQAMDLTPDTVKQRLSRGRKLLKLEVAAIVESTLTSSRPAKTFTTAVLVALPAITPGTAAASAAGATAAAAAAKGSVAAKISTTGMGIATTVLAPMIHLFIGILGIKMQLDDAQPRERRFIVKLLLTGMGLLLAFGAGLYGAHLAGINLLSSSPYSPAIVMLVFACIWIPLCRWGGNRMKQMRIEDGTWVEAQAVTGTEPGKLTPAGVVTRFAGGIFATTAWLAALAIKSNDWTTLAIIAATSAAAFAIGTSFCLRRPETYFKSMGLSAGVPAFVAIVVTGDGLGLWTGPSEASSTSSNWLLPMLNGTIISILTVNLLAWKRDADMRKSAKRE